MDETQPRTTTRRTMKLPQAATVLAWIGGAAVLFGILGGGLYGYRQWQTSRLTATVHAAQTAYADSLKDAKDAAGNPVKVPQLVPTTFRTTTYLYADANGKPQAVVEIVDPSGKQPPAFVQVGVSDGTTH